VDKKYPVIILYTVYNQVCVLKEYFLQIKTTVIIKDFGDEWDFEGRF
jgi:hypothetical protein